jgi:hypothetical protein
MRCGEHGVRGDDSAFGIWLSAWKSLWEFFCYSEDTLLDSTGWLLRRREGGDRLYIKLFGCSEALGRGWVLRWTEASRSLVQQGFGRQPPLDMENHLLN